MRPFIRKLVFLAIIAVALLVSNPDLRKHQDKIILKFKEANPLTSLVLPEDMIRPVIAYENYYLFSMGKITVADQSISFGIAGFVVVFGDLDLMKYKDKIMEYVK